MDSKKSSRAKKPAPASSSPETPKTVPLAPRRRASAVKPARSAQAAAPKAARAGAPEGARPVKKKGASAIATPAPVAAPSPRPVTDEEIRVRAYFLALEYAGDDRHDIDFWLIAERELRRRT